MMEQRRALTLPFTLKKDNLMENPLRIPMTCLSSECGRLEGQVSWTAFAGYKLRHNSQHKNGSMMLNCGNAATVSLEMTRRKPLLLLTDVLKTEPGRAYMERMRKGLLTRSSRERAAARRRTPPQSCSDKSHVAESRSDGRKSSTPKGREKTLPLSLKRSNLRRRIQYASDEVVKDAEMENKNEDHQDEEEDKFGEVVDCGLSLSWEPSEDTASQDKFSPAGIREKRAEPEKDVQHSSRRKRNDSGSQCNGTNSPKRQRRSVLRLTGEDVRDRREATVAVCLAETCEHAELESLDNIVQFTVGGDDQTPVLLPVSLMDDNVVKSLQRGSATSAESMTEAMASEPIVLSSDDEESGSISRRITAAHRRMAVGNTVIQGLSRLKAPPRRAEQHIEVLQVIDQGVPHLVRAHSLRNDDYTQIEVAFSALHCGGYHGKSNGDVMIAKEKIIIPLQDAFQEMEVLLSFDRRELRRYSVWEQYELEAKEFCFKDDDDPYPAAVLLFFVSDTAAAAVQQDLCRMGIKRSGHAQAGKASPFILLTLTSPLEGINGALLRSVLEIECLNSIGQEQVPLRAKVDRFAHLDDFLNPVLSLEESIELMSRTGLDSHLLSMLGVSVADLVVDVDDRGCSRPDRDKCPAALIQPEVGARMMSEKVEVENSPLPEQDTSTSGEQNSSPGPEPKGSPVPEPEPFRTLELSAALELDPSPTLESVPPQTRDPDTSQTLEPEASLALESETSSTRESEASLALEPVTSLSVEPKTPPVLEQEMAKEEGTTLKPPDLEDEHPPCEKKNEEQASAYTLCHRRNKGSYSVSMCKPNSKWTKYKHLGLARRLIQFPPPPQKGGITVTMEDMQCLDSGQFLNDVIIDFYLKYLLQNAPSSVAQRTHIFSSFFFKQLTRRDNVSEGSSSESCQRQRRHQRVKTWTRHVDIFNKDFLFVPVNQEAHWYLVVICFPGLDEPRFEDWAGPSGQDEAEESQHEEARGCKMSTDAAELPPSLSHDNSVNTPTEKSPEDSTKDLMRYPVSCTEQTCQPKTVCQRPCILIMDSLKLSLHERVFKLLRDYLQSEWEVRRGTSREFGPDQMKGSHCKVPLQDNSSDCGLYLLQYVESFLKDPVVHFELPLCLERWFPRQQVRRKRDDIRDLILYLYRLQNLDLRHVQLPSF